MFWYYPFSLLNNKNESTKRGISLISDMLTTPYEPNKSSLTQKKSEK